MNAADSLQALDNAAVRTWHAQHAAAQRQRDYTAAAVGYWLGTLGYVPDVEEIRARLGFSRATAYRWVGFAQRAAQLGLEATP